MSVNLLVPLKLMSFNNLLNLAVHCPLWQHLLTLGTLSVLKKMLLRLYWNTVELYSKHLRLQMLYKIVSVSDVSKPIYVTFPKQCF